MNVSKIKSFFKVNKKSFFYAGLFVFSFFLFSDAAFAVEEEGFLTKGIEGVNFLLIISGALLGATTSLVSLFLTPDWVNGSVFGLDGYMKSIWILISNVVYFIFAFILILIAFMNIIGKGDKWELKSALPKFIVGVIMVPFTWFFVQFILSISAILTVAVLTLPYDTFGGTPEYQKVQGSFSQMISKLNSENGETNESGDKEYEIPTTFVLNLSQGVFTGSGSDTQFRNGKEFFDQGNKESVKDILSGEKEPNSIFGIISLYTYGIMKVQDTDVAKAEDVAGVIGDVTDLTLKVIFDALFVIVYMILMIALFLALLVRGIKLWVYAMLSPTFGLLYFFDKADGVGEGNGKFGIKDFISLALVPVYVSAALSFGLLFIMVANHGMGTSSLLTSCDNKKYEQKFSGMETESIKNKMTCLGIGSFTFAIQGSHAGSPSGNALGKIIMQLFGIVILWMSVMVALKQSEITNKITEPIQQIGNNVGGFVAKAPLYTPIIPGLPSVSGMSQISRMPQTAVENRVQRNVGPYREGIDKLFGSESMSTNDRTNLNKFLANGNVEGKELKGIQDILRSNAQKLGHKDRAFKEYLEKFNAGLKNSGMPGWKESSELYNSSGKLTTYGAGILHIDNLGQGPDNIRGNGKVEKFIQDTEVASGSSSSDTSSDTKASSTASVASIKEQDKGAYRVDLKVDGEDRFITINGDGTIDNNKDITDVVAAISSGLNSTELDKILDKIKDKKDFVSKLNQGLGSDLQISIIDKGDNKGKVKIDRKKED